MKKVCISDDQGDKVLSSAGINWQAFLYLFSLNIVSVFFANNEPIKAKTLS